ncbi:MAG: shikimate dehydrogenase [Muribaculaceae bacterium]|nr:shikimate dehydrogenase [Muribaculaceae bacterium]
MKEYGLIGKKLGHSFSAEYFNSKFKSEGIDARYQLFEIPSIEGVSNLIDSLPDLEGLNVTIPFKKEILPYLDYLSPQASAIGAVNCVKIVRDGERNILTGHNTDATGFMEALLPLLTTDMSRALVLGQGGASLAVIYALKELGLEVTKVSRTPGDDVITYDRISKDVMQTHHLIINCTPLGMYPNIDASPAIPYQYINDKFLCFDLVYNPEFTEFMRLSAERGAKVSNGLKMLYNQADLAWQFWNNK